MNAEGLHLSNQEYSVQLEAIALFFTTSHHIVGEQVCIRSERGFCGISYTACADMVGALYIAEYFAKLGCIETNKLKILS